jgi:hypothetical protein
MTRPPRPTTRSWRSSRTPCSSSAPERTARPCGREGRRQEARRLRRLGQSAARRTRVAPAQAVRSRQSPEQRRGRPHRSRSGRGLTTGLSRAATWPGSTGAEAVRPTRGRPHLGGGALARRGRRHGQVNVGLLVHHRLGVTGVEVVVGRGTPPASSPTPSPSGPTATNCTPTPSARALPGRPRTPGTAPPGGGGSGGVTRASTSCARTLTHPDTRAGVCLFGQARAG